MENKILANGKERYSTGDEGMYQGGEVRVDEFKNGTYHFTLLDVDDGYGVAKAETFEKSFAYFPSLAKGGDIMVKWQDVQVGDMARVIETNKSGVVTYAYGRKFNVTFPNGDEKTYDAKELEFIPEENLTGEIEGERRMGMEYGDGGIIEIVVVSKFPNKKHLFTDRFGFDGEMDEKEAKEQAKKDWEDESKEKHSAKKGSSIVEVLTNSEYREKYLTPKMADGGIVQSKDLVSLIQEGAKNGTSKIMVEFNPAYDEKEHSSLSEELQESLKVPKVEIFDIIQEGLDVIELTSNNDVKSLKWFTDKEKFEEGGMFSMMTKYQVEKEYKRIQDELNKLRDKYGDFETEEIAKLVSQEDEIITLLYGKNFSGVGKQFYANGGIIEHGGKNIYVFKVKLGQDIDEAFRDMFIANEGRLEKKTWDNTINQLKTSLGSKFERAWKNFKSEFDIAVDRTDYVNPYYFAKGGLTKVKSKMANGGLIESGLYLIGKPVKEGKVYAQKVAEVNPNGTVDFASDYARKITDFVYKNVKRVSSVEELMVTPQFSEGGAINIPIKKNKKKDEIYTILLDSCDAGPFDGGCLTMAHAIKNAIGGELVSFVRADDFADHVAVKKGEYIYDADGFYNEKDAIKKFNKAEMANVVKIRPYKEGDVPNAPLDIDAAKRISQMLSEGGTTDGVAAGQVYYSEGTGKDFIVDEINDGSVYIHVNGAKKTMGNSDIIRMSEFNRFVRDGVFVPKFEKGGMVTAQEREEVIKSGTIMSNTNVAMRKIKSLYPKAVGIPVCAFGCYYSIYEDDKYENLIAEFEYINISKEDKIPKELEPPSSFGSYFKVIWKNKKEKGGFVRSLKEKFKRPRL